MWQPFFLYFNPTVPHSSNSVEAALRDFSCRDTAAGTLATDPVIPGMTDDGDCEAYRDSIFDRAESDDDLGAIWVDDSVGALLMALEDRGILGNTIFVFQGDHGMDPKGALYEGSVRIPQFIHYPAGIRTRMQFDFPVSVMDTSATLLDLAGITPSYEIDGLSWKEGIFDENSMANWEHRCLYFELGTDRAIRCGCYKYLDIFDQDDSTTYRRGNQKGLSNDEQNLFNLCGQSENYVSKIKGDNVEGANLIVEEPNTAQQFEMLHDCHLERIMVGDFSQCGGPDTSDTSLASQLRLLHNFSAVSLIAVGCHLHFV